MVNSAAAMMPTVFIVVLRLLVSCRWQFPPSAHRTFRPCIRSHLIKKISCAPQAGERAGLGRVWPHMLRHSAGYALSNKGHDFRLLQDFMGHRDPRHTSRYTRTASRVSSGCVSEVASRPSRLLGRRPGRLDLGLGLGRLANRLRRWVHLRRIRQMRIRVAGFRWVGIGHSDYPFNPIRSLRASSRSFFLLARLSATAAAYLASAACIAFCNAALAVRKTSDVVLRCCGPLRVDERRLGFCHPMAMPLLGGGN
jgi:hypothetical protein